MRRLESFWSSRSPAARLATAYAAIIVTLSIIFSVILYNLSTAQLTEGLRHQYSRLRPYDNAYGPPSFDPMQFDAELLARKHALAIRLVYFNVVILAVGSGLSYWLSKRTMQPIEEALAAQTQFTGDASHELRTPLTAMQTEIEVALRSEARMTKEEAFELLRSNLEEVAKLRALSDGLLRLARGDNQLELREVALRDVVTEATARVAHLADKKHITITAQGDPLKVTGDHASLTELGVILLDNAIKYSPAKTTITIATRAHNKTAHLAITDQGQGIPLDDLPHIFDRFYRADKSRTKDQSDSYGLGLSIAHKIVLLHHGSIVAASDPKKGSIFTVKLPLA